MENNNEIVVDVQDLKKYFPIKAGVLQRTVGHVRAVDGVSFQIKKGQTFGLVGESGCGKSTLGRTMLRLIEPTDGSVKINGTDMCAIKKRELRPLRPTMQMIFQDPFSSLDLPPCSTCPSVETLIPVLAATSSMRSPLSLRISRITGPIVYPSYFIVVPSNVLCHFS